jgi:hypothetical protein
MTIDPTTWVKASRSNGTGACVEMRGQEGTVQVRDTKAHGAGHILDLSPATFAGWVEAAKSGDLDHLVR